MDILLHKATGASFTNPTRTLTTKTTATGFVDDTNGRTNLFDSPLERDSVALTEAANKDAQLWHDLLDSSGGALEISKCNFQCIQWKFLNCGTPVMSHDPDASMTLVSRNSTVQLKATPLDIPHKTLGHYKNPIGNTKQQYDAIFKRIKELISGILSR